MTDTYLLSTYLVPGLGPVWTTAETNAVLSITELIMSQLGRFQWQIRENSTHTE